MATRATYQFRRERSTEGTRFAPFTVYIHHDGYASGGALYLWNAHHYANQRGGMATAFIRANEGAELTESHQAHGDTQYRYTLTDATLKVECRHLSSDAWHQIYYGTWWEFVNANPQSIDNFSPLREVSLSRYCSRSLIVSRSQLVERMEAKRAELEQYRERFPDFIGNISGMESQLQDWVAALADYDTQGDALDLDVAIAN